MCTAEEDGCRAWWTIRCQSGSGLVNKRTQLADIAFLEKITELLHYIRTLNQALSVSLTLSITDTVQIVSSTRNHTSSDDILQSLNQDFGQLTSPRVTSPRLH